MRRRKILLLCVLGIASIQLLGLAQFRDASAQQTENSQPDLPLEGQAAAPEGQEMDSDDRVPVIEAYPQRLLARMQVRDRMLEQAARESDVGELEAVVRISRLWDHSPITVAFLGGDSELHRRIATAANEWTEHGAFKFDFGHGSTSNRYRTWSRRDRDFAADIRISFDDEGYYSLLGEDSRDPAITRPSEASMNLEGFNTALPDDWQSTVLHEFGHALGLEHEHQHPGEPCDFRFEDEDGYVATRSAFGEFVPDSKRRKPGLYTVLGGPPNEWDKATVDHNLKALKRSRAFRTGPFDAKSIMKYDFESWMFITGGDSHCFGGVNGVISAGDKASIADAYPAAADERQQIDVAKQQHELLARGLPSLALPEAPAAVQNSSGDSGASSIDIEPLAERLARIRPKTPDIDQLEAAGSVLIEMLSQDDIAPERKALERVIGPADFLPAEFVVAGAARQLSVARIAVKATFTHPQAGTFFPDDGWGSGFLVSPSLLMTNNHVIDSPNFGETKLKAQFNYQRRLEDGVISDVDTYEFEPANFFYTDSALDFTIVRVKGKTPAGITTPAAPLQLPDARWGHYRLSDSVGLTNNDYFDRMSLNIIQHPAGRPKELVVHDNFLENLLPNHIQYTSDTEGGSSGSPVFDNRWILYALHHSAGEKNPDGTWKNNQGVRIDKIILHIQNSTVIPQMVKQELGL